MNKTELNRTVQPMGLVAFYQMLDSTRLELMDGCSCVSNGFKRVKVCNFLYLGHVLSRRIRSILSKSVLLMPKNEVDVINQYRLPVFQMVARCLFYMRYIAAGLFLWPYGIPLVLLILPTPVSTQADLSGCNTVQDWSSWRTRPYNQSTWSYWTRWVRCAAKIF